MRSPLESPHFPAMDRLRSTAAALRQQLDQGQIAHQDMEAALQSVTAMDAEGYEWGMASDLSQGGALSLFRRLPGGPPEFVANDDQFAYYPAADIPGLPPPPAASQAPYDPYAPPADPYDSDPAEYGSAPSAAAPPPGFYESVEPPVHGLPVDESSPGVMGMVRDRKVIVAVVVLAAVLSVVMLFMRSGGEADAEGPADEAATDAGAAVTQPSAPGAGSTASTTSPPIAVNPPDVALPRGFVEAWGGFLNAAVAGDVATASRWLSPEAVDGMSRLDLLEVASSWAGARVLGLQPNPTLPNIEEAARGQITVGVFFVDPSVELPVAASEQELVKRLEEASLCPEGSLTFRKVDEVADIWRLEDWKPLGRACGR